MYHDPSKARRPNEEFLAELTDAAYRVALRHEFQGSFIQVELDLWTALRKVLGKRVDVTDIPQFSSAGPEEDEEGTGKSRPCGSKVLAREGLTCPG